jgi:hypothetical protein
MTLTKPRLSFTQRCSIQRDSAPGGDPWDASDVPDWDDVATDVPCRAWENAAREPVDADRTVTILDRRIMVPADTDVTEHDRIGDVTDRGTVLFPGPMNVEGVLRWPDFLELVVQEIR